MSELAHKATRTPEYDINEISGNTVLIVDDSESERIRLVHLMKGLGLKTIDASNGAQAMELALQHRPGLIISDWYMPVMDGLELCKKLRDSALGEDVYLILVTGEDRQQHLARGLDAGADDFLTKPYVAEEIGARVRAGHRALVAREKLKTSNRELDERLLTKQQAIARARENLAGAAKLQSRMLPPPRTVIGDIRLAHVIRSPDLLTGDVLGCVSLGDNGDVGFFHADAAGHGATAALNSFAMAKLMHSLNSRGLLMRKKGPVPPHRLMAYLNRHFASDEHCDQYFTMIYGTLNSHTGQGMLCQAGHPHPVIVTPEGNTRRLGEGGMPVGLLDSAKYESIHFSLECGDRLLVYSDGATEVENGDGKMPDLDELTHAAVAERGLPLQPWLRHLEAWVVNWAGRDQLDDDLSLLALERLVPGEASPRVVK